MKKSKGWAFISDLDVLWDIGSDDEQTNWGDSIVDDIDVLGKEDKTPEQVNEPEVIAEVIEDATKPVIEKVEEPVVEETTDVTKDDESKVKEGEDLDKWLDDLLKSNAETDDKVEEIKDVVDASGDEHLKKLVDELQSSRAEDKLTIEELQKQVEIANSRYINKFWDEEELSIYKTEIEKLQNNPRLMALVKYFKTENEKIKPKLITILSDMLYDITWEDIADLLNKKDTNALSAVLNGWGSDSPLIDEINVEEDKPLNYEESRNNLF